MIVINWLGGYRGDPSILHGFLKTATYLRAMLTISLAAFARTGTFGPVALGMTKDEAIAHLGKPTNINQYYAESAGLNYGWYEFFYNPLAPQIRGIQNDHLSMRDDSLYAKRMQREAYCFRNKSFQVDTWFLQPGRDIYFAEAIAHVQQAGLEFEEVFDPFSGWRIVFPSGVFIDFGDAWDAQDQPDPPTDKAILVVNGIRQFLRPS